MFLNDMDKSYLDNTNDKRKVIDFIAGMTDDLFVKEIVEKD
jgi:dGTP triphosphohydrolase